MLTQLNHVPAVTWATGYTFQYSLNSGSCQVLVYFTGHMFSLPANVILYMYTDILVCNQTALLEKPNNIS